MSPESPLCQYGVFFDRGQPARKGCLQRGAMPAPPSRPPRDASAAPRCKRPSLYSSDCTYLPTAGSFQSAPSAIFFTTLPCASMKYVSGYMNVP